MPNSELKIYTDDELPQGSDEWKEVRCGVITASRIGNLITPTGKVKSGAAFDTFCLEMAADRLVKQPESDFQSFDMLRGIEDEVFAKELLEGEEQKKDSSYKIDSIGFAIRTFDDGLRLGYSPDGLIMTEGLLECKSRKRKYQLETILSDEVPSGHMAQCQEGMLVMGRNWIDYMSVSFGLHAMIKRVYADPKWQEVLLDAARKAESRIQEIIDAYRQRTSNANSLTGTRYIPTEWRDKKAEEDLEII